MHKVNRIQKANRIELIIKNSFTVPICFLQNADNLELNKNNKGVTTVQLQFVTSFFI